LVALTGEAEMKIGHHLHRPGIVERSNNDVGRVAQVLERVVASNSDLILFSDLPKREESRTAV
jgi:hypothetical protein